MKIKKLSLLLMSFFILTPHFPVFAVEKTADASSVYIFYSPGCHRCNEVKTKLMPGIENRYKDRIRFEYYDISEIENYKLLISLREKYDPALKITVPVFFLNGHFITGEGNLDKELEGFILKYSADAKGNTEKVSPADLIAYFKDFKFLTVAGAGLIDGINPCAFTVIVFFISYLALQGYRKRDLIAIGLAFIFAVFLTYFLLGLGLFGFLYRIKGIWYVLKFINLSLGIFSVVLGFICIYDFFKFKETKDSERLILQLPASVKRRIHKVIGVHYRSNKNSGNEAAKRHILKMLVSAFITGFLVSILEAVCTGQTYLPTIAFVLKTTDLKLPALGYLFIYNLMFILPLIIIFICALFGVSSSQFAGFLKNKMLTIKILMALLFFGLGIFLIWRA